MTPHNENERATEVTPLDGRDSGQAIARTVEGNVTPRCASREPPFMTGVIPMPDPALDFDAALLGLLLCDRALAEEFPPERDGGPYCPCNDHPTPCAMCQAQFDAYRENIARDMERIGEVTERVLRGFRAHRAAEDGVIEAAARFRAAEGLELEADGGLACSICGIAVSPAAKQACGTCCGGVTGGAA